MAVVRRNGTRAGWSGVAFAAAVAVGLAWEGAAQGVASNSGHLRVLTTRSIATVLEKIGSNDERRTGRKLNVTTDLAARLVRRIDAGESFDFLVASPAIIDDLIKRGKIIPETRTDVARSGVGVAVRAGVAKPDISSVDAFKRALLAARSIAYLKEGQSGVYIARVVERLGLAEVFRPKLTLPESDIVSELVSRSEIELGIVVITQILTTPGVARAGPLPSELQTQITFTTGVSARSQAIDAAKNLMAALKGPLAVSVMRSQGMVPATASGAQELKVLSAVGMRQVLRTLQPIFERKTRNKLSITFDSGALSSSEALGPPPWD